MADSRPSGRPDGVVSASSGPGIVTIPNYDTVSVIAIYPFNGDLTTGSALIVVSPYLPHSDGHGATFFCRFVSSMFFAGM
jgi:hypothetical protein